MNRKAYIVTKKKKNKKKRLLWVVTPMLVLLFAVGGYAASLYFKAQDVANQSYEALGDELAETTELTNTSILFIGVDDSESRNYQDATRSDALILATFNKEDKSVKLLSIPRDSYVYIPENEEYTKINHAYATGGAASTVETVENLLDIPVDYYVRMNFYAFIDVINELDGIEVDVPYEMYEKDSNDQHNAIHLEEGLQTLNGEEALAFARTRKSDNDIERGKRQQQVIEAVIEKVTSASSFSKYTSIMEAIGNNMKTNLTFSHMKSFVAFAVKNPEMSIESIQLQGEDSTIDGIYYYSLDEEALEETKASLKAHLEGLDATSSTVATENNGNELSSESSSTTEEEEL
ncbi:MAG: LCP family protein [Bacillus sp. (in: firmicutes)]